MSLGLFIALCFTTVIVLWFVSVGLTIKARTTREPVLGRLLICNGLLAIVWYLTLGVGIAATVWWIFV